MLPTPASGDNNNNSVSFGRVNVHKHRMTLGNHPFASGIPVELSWDVESSDEMSMEAYESTSSTSDANTDQHHDTSSNSQSSPHRLTSQIRREIAEEHHSRESIFAILKEASLLRHSIVKSLEEDHHQDPEMDALLYMMDPDPQSLHRSAASVSLPPLAPPLDENYRQPPTKAMPLVVTSHKKICSSWKVGRQFKRI